MVAAHDEISDNPSSYQNNYLLFLFWKENFNEQMIQDSKEV